MAHVSSGVSRRSYLSTEPFNNSIYSYSTALVNNVLRGTLTPLAGATAANCPSGRIIHETGKMLFPTDNDDEYLVSVYDPISMLTGFINPNESIYSIMNTDRANFLLDGPHGTGSALSSNAPAVVGTIDFTAGYVDGGFKKINVSSLNITASSKIF